MVKQIVSGAFEALHDQSLPTIEMLQSTFPDNKDFMINISTFFDPRYVFLIYAPILFALNRKVGHRTIAALTLTEWANQILKWLLAGERPYWYVHERAHELANATIDSATLTHQQYDLTSNNDQLLLAKPLAALKQFPVTCELGAGSPSGHAMVTATVWYILIDAYLRGEINFFNPNPAPKAQNQQQQQRRPVELNLGDKVAKLTWSMYTIILLLVSLSRVYLACHFPHQCLCGAILGVVVAKLVIERLPMKMMTRRHYALATVGMFVSVMSIYALLKSMGVNPLWSVDKAMRWCVKKEYIHLDTSPFLSMMRYLGFCLGAGLAYKSTETASRSSISSKVLAAGGSIILGQMLLSIPLPKSNLYLFYAISFGVYTLFSYAIAGPVPKLANRFTTQHMKLKAY